MNFGPRNKIKTGGGLNAVYAVVLVLLVFFLLMVIATKQENEKEVVVASENNFNPAITVVVTKDNLYYIALSETEKDKRPFDAIRELIGEKVLASDSKQLKIEGHQLAKYETVYNVVALAQKNNWPYRLDYTRMTADE